MISINIGNVMEVLIGLLLGIGIGYWLNKKEVLGEFFSDLPKMVSVRFRDAFKKDKIVNDT